MSMRDLKESGSGGVLGPIAATLDNHIKIRSRGDVARSVLKHTDVARSVLKRAQHRGRRGLGPISGRLFARAMSECLRSQHVLCRKWVGVVMAESNAR